MNKTNISKLKQFVSILTDKSYRVDTNSYLSNEVVEYLKQLNGTIRLDDVFVYYNKNEKNSIGKTGFEYCLESVKCNNCEEIFLNQTFGKVTLLKYLKTGNYICSDCEKKIQRKLDKVREENSSNNKIEVQERKNQNTQNYIENYLNPANSWKKECSVHDRYNEITQVFVDWKSIKDYICEMNYKDFLCTPYWKAVAAKAKQLAGYKCQLCMSSKKLVVHHKTYKNHGYEHGSIKTDLIVLCDSCHKKFHNITEEA